MDYTRNRIYSIKTVTTLVAIWTAVYLTSKSQVYVIEQKTQNCKNGKKLY